MPGKSRYGKGKHPHQSKKSKAIRRQVNASQQQKTAIIPERETPVESKPALKTPKAASVPSVQHPYIVDELKRIGIMAAAIIVLLIVLSVIIS